MVRNGENNTKPAANTEKVAPIHIVGITPIESPNTPEISAPIGIQPQTMNLIEAFILPNKGLGQIRCLAVT